MVELGVENGKIGFLTERDAVLMKLHNQYLPLVKHLPVDLLVN